MSKLVEALKAAKQVPVSDHPMYFNEPASNRVELPNGKWGTKQWTKKEREDYRRGVLGKID
jgi:hypothetical protein